MRKAFTLVELLIVIAIIAILAAIAIPQYTKYIAKAAASNAEATLSACMSAAAAQFADNGSDKYTCNLPADVKAGTSSSSQNATYVVIVLDSTNGTFDTFHVGNGTTDTNPIYLNVKGHKVKCTGNETTNTVSCEPV